MKREDLKIRESPPETYKEKGRDKMLAATSNLHECLITPIAATGKVRKTERLNIIVTITSSMVDHSFKVRGIQSIIPKKPENTNENGNADERRCNADATLS